jgi:sirohydrochlorin cobaltochelatase
MRKYTILVGHGAVPKDAPKSLVEEFKRLERTSPGSSELREVDRKLRNWPRTSQTDPYKEGLEKIAESLQKRMPNHSVLEAYNEFCSPSLEEALEFAARQGAESITVIPTMFTRGGIHSETEIPEIIEKFSKERPQISTNYVWPFDLETIATMLAEEINRVEKSAISS